MNCLVKSDRVAREEQASESVLGKWFWIKIKDWNDDEDSEGTPHLGCITNEGSNYVEIEGVGKHGNWSHRVHNDDFFNELTLEPEPQKYIDERIKHWQGVAASLIAQVGEITRALGINAKALSGPSGANALTVPAGKRAVKDYKNALVKAKDKTLPKLFEQIKDANKMAATWMAAPILGMRGQLGDANETVDAIKKRIYAIELYAGVTEEIEQIASGDPSPADEKVHLFQRRLCMDEECLVDYHAGGMEFKSLGKFEAWLLKPSNLNRIMPRPRCIVSMIVRRRAKEREDLNSLSLFINVKLDQADRSTFLYMRNGDNVYRLETDIDFSSSLFPDRATFDPQRPMMAEMFGGSVRKIIMRDEYEAMVAAEESRKRKEAQWYIDNPFEQSKWNEGDGDKWNWECSNPYRHRGIDLSDSRFRSFDPSDVYYDDIGEEITDKIAHYNRIALIVQGLFDRTHIFQPHRMPKVWQPDDFLKAVELVYDNSAVIHSGDAPDFDAYRTEINASLAVGSITIGQEDYWERAEAVRFNNQYHSERFAPRKHHRPYGNPGPGYATSVMEWNRSKRNATFRWERERQTARRWRSDKLLLPCAITVPAASLFNVSSYALGDYKRFYTDVRTRAQYLQWAPFLLGAEDWHAGRRKWA